MQYLLVIFTSTMRRNLMAMLITETENEKNQQDESTTFRLTLISKTFLITVITLWRSCYFNLLQLWHLHLKIYFKYLLLIQTVLFSLAIWPFCQYFSKQQKISKLYHTVYLNLTVLQQKYHVWSLLVWRWMTGTENWAKLTNPSL